MLAKIGNEGSIDHGEKGPGRAEREGISIVELFEMFPNDAAAERWFEQQRWPNGITCPRCDSRTVFRHCVTQAHALSVQGLPETFQRSFWNRHAGLELGLTEMGHRHLHDDGRHQRHIQYETAPGSENDAIHSMALDATDSASLCGCCWVYEWMKPILAAFNGINTSRNKL